MDLGIVGKKAIVCASSTGIGLGCATALAEEGIAELILVARNEERLNATKTQLESATNISITAITADVSTTAGQTAILEAMPEPDILVNNCGGPPAKPFTEISDDDWQRALQNSLFSAVNLIKATVPGMVERGFGRVVNITSMGVRVPVPNLDLSTASRMALTGYVAGVSRQVVAQNVTINNILPGPIMTDRLAALGDAGQALVARVPAGRAGRPDEMGAMCAFLCSQKAGFITGQNILVDGGISAFTI